MKILGIQFGSSKPSTQPQPQSTEGPNSNYFGFTAPFLKVGDGNLSTPYISPAYLGAGGYIRFGQDNLSPNLLRQLYHIAPLFGSIINFTRNAVIGGGYEFIGAESAQDKVALYQFENKVGLKKLIKKITKDGIMFENINFLIENDSNGVAKSLKRIPLDELRWDKNLNFFTYCEDFSRGIGEKTYPKYRINEPNHCGILSFRLDDDDSIYPWPSYASANNWGYLSNEESFLQKSNITNSIFPSTIFKFPKKPTSDEEWAQYKKTLESAKGASNSGRAIAFFENGLDQLPIVESMPTNQNDKLFNQTSERMDNVICQAFTIDPVLMGIRTTGSLSSGSDIKQSYIIWEKNKVMPLRNEIEDIINVVKDLFKVKGTFSLNNYQIVDTEIVEVKK